MKKKNKTFLWVGLGAVAIYLLYRYGTKAKAAGSTQTSVAGGFGGGVRYTPTGFPSTSPSGTPSTPPSGTPSTPPSGTPVVPVDPLVKPFQRDDYIPPPDTTTPTPITSPILPPPSTSNLQTIINTPITPPTEPIYGGLNYQKAGTTKPTQTYEY